eukprot:COSAG02_NODE_43508_length_374_cov_0.625455_1_plen_65_part_10
MTQNSSQRARGRWHGETVTHRVIARRGRTLVPVGERVARCSVTVDYCGRWLGVMAYAHISSLKRG